jgi:hypothetical protein
VFTEIEAFKTLFGLDAEIILSGGIDDSKGCTGFLVKGDNVKQALRFAEKYNRFSLNFEGEFIF